MNIRNAVILVTGANRGLGQSLVKQLLAAGAKKVYAAARDPASWLSIPSSATYSASKSAAWSLTNGLRGELRGQGTQVVAVHVGYMDTDMSKRLGRPEGQPGRRGAPGGRGVGQRQRGSVGRRTEPQRAAGPVRRPRRVPRREVGLGRVAAAPQ